MNDEETRRAHRRRPLVRQDPRRRRRRLRRPRARGAPARGAGPRLEEHLRHRQGRGRDHQRPRGHLDQHADQVGQQLLREPLRLRVGAHQEPRRRAPVGRQGRRGDRSRTRTTRRRSTVPTMLTTDLALRVDPEYEKISRRFLANPDEFALAFAKAWYKLLHRDMGPVSRYLGPVGGGAAAVAGPGARGRPRAGRRRGRRRAQGEAARLGPVRLRSWCSTAWASAASFRGTDKRGGANGARIRLEPQRDWEVNEPAELATCCRRSSRSSRSSTRPVRRQAGLAGRPDRARRRRGGREGGEGRRRRRHRAVHARAAPTPRRSRPTSSRSRCSSRGPTASATTSEPARSSPPETLLLDRAYMLELTAPEMTVLVGGLRALGTNVGRHAARRLHRPARRADERLLRQPARHGHGVEGVGVDGERLRGPRPRTGEVKWTATAVDLVFGSNSQLRALAEVYARDERRRSSCATSSRPGTR